MQVTASKVIFLLGFCLVCDIGACAQTDDYRSSWATTISLNEIGRGDLNRTYDELLDYWFPRQLSSPASDKCYLVLRYLPDGGKPHQVNIIFSSSTIISVWTFELPDGMALSGSDQGQNLARTIHVSAKSVIPSISLQDSIKHSLAVGLPTYLRPGAVLHGDKYQAWAKCGLSQFASEITVPPNSNNGETQWMNSLWRQTQHP